MTRKTKEQIDRERQADIVAGKQLVPKGSCHYCGFTVPRLAHWCSSSCAQSYADEKQALAARGA